MSTPLLMAIFAICILVFLWAAIAAWRQLGTPFVVILPLMLGFGAMFSSQWSGWFDPLDYSRLYFDSLKWSLTLSALFVGATVKSLRPHRRSRGILAGVLLSSVMAFVPFGNVAERFLNGWHDSAPLLSQTVLVVNKGSISSRDKGVEIWLEHSNGVEHHWIPISLADYQMIAPNQSRVTVVTKRGRLGFQWLVGCTVAR